MKKKFTKLLMTIGSYSFLGLLIQAAVVNMLFAVEVKPQKAESVYDVSISIDLQNASVTDVFRLVEGKTLYRFTYEMNDIDPALRLDLQFRKIPVSDILFAISRNSDLSFKQINNTIYVRKNGKGESPQSIDIIIQTLNVSGRVTAEENGEPLPGVNVIEKGTKNGTVSDVDGRYSLNVSQGSTLVFSFIGFLNKEIPVGDRTVIDAALQIDVRQLEEIVVIGYGEQAKEDLTGAVSAIGERDFNRGVMSSPQDLLVGKVAGVSIVSEGGAPGSNAVIRIRGGSSLTASNDPLIVIDGFPVDNSGVSGLSNPLSVINPNDIESFTVLKDASATAIYGSRASNGVIIITTKKGTEGKPKVELQSQASVSSPIRFVDVMDGDEYRALISELHDEGFSGINDAAIKRQGNENTDWQREIFRNSLSHNHTVTVSGSIKPVPYRVSYGYTDQQGILKTTSMRRHSLSLNLNPSLLNDHLKININAKETFARTSFGDQNAVGEAVRFDPTQPVRNENNRYAGYYAWTTENLPDGSMNPEGSANTFASNPVALLALRENNADINRFIGNAQFDLKIPFVTGLSANLNIGMDHSYTDGYDDALPGSTWTYRDYSGPQGRLRDYTAKSVSRLLDFLLKYDAKIGNAHQVNLIGGYSWQHFEREGSTFDRDGDETRPPLEDSEFINENFIISFFGRMNYSLLDKYLLTATLRTDGSSRFTGNNKWGTFPSLALAWKINQEPFMINSDLVSQLKLRLGYGETGQQDLASVGNPNYPALPIYRISTDGASYQFGDKFVRTLRPNAYDANIRWESTTTYNAGIDFGLWNDRVSGSIEVYQRKTKDLINNIPIAGGSNFSNFLVTNVGNLENKGFEITLNAMAVAKNDFTWTIGTNLTRNSNKITKLTKIDDPNDPGVAVGGISGGRGNNIQIHTVGFPAYSFHVYQQVYDADGNPVEGLYVDRTGNGGEVSSSDLNKRHLGSPSADALVGLNSRLTYKNLDFSFSGRFSIGNYVYNNIVSQATLSSLYDATGYFANIPKSARDIGFSSPQFWSDMFVEDASFFKMDNISLGYNFGAAFREALNIHLNLTVQNAFIVTNYSGLDPELTTGIDNNIYPRPRTFLLGLNVNF